MPPEYSEHEIGLRLEEADLDKFERCASGLLIPGLQGTGPGGRYTPQDLMMKRMSRSSADHLLQIPSEGMSLPFLCCSTKTDDDEYTNLSFFSASCSFYSYTPHFPSPSPSFTIPLL